MDFRGVRVRGQVYQAALDWDADDRIWVARVVRGPARWSTLRCHGPTAESAHAELEQLLTEVG